MLEIKRNNTAIYCRISVEDRLTDKESIKNQKEILTSYVLQNGWIIYDIYIDDGYSGTNFNRPSFIKMINDIEKGNIDIVVTKDLSRLGRNYLETGKYTDIYFPNKNIRYIALNDNIDSFNELNEFIPLKNIINEWYALDISKKIRATLNKQMESGEFKRAGHPLYGYMYDSNFKRIPNPDTKDNIKIIFDLASNGYSLNNIKKYLEDNKIYSPYGYYYTFIKYKNIDNPFKWNISSISSIISNREYLGHYIRGKYVTRFKSKYRKKSSNEYLFENVFEPLVSLDLFLKANKLIKYNKNNIYLINPFNKIAICEVCNSFLVLKRHTSHNYYEERLTCPHNKEPFKGSIKLDDLKYFVSNELFILRDKILSNFNRFNYLANILIPKEINNIKIKNNSIISNNNNEINIIRNKIFNNINSNIDKNIINNYNKRINYLLSINNNLLNYNYDLFNDFNNFINSINILNNDNIFDYFIISNLISNIFVLKKSITIKYKLDFLIKAFIGDSNE